MARKSTTTKAINDDVARELEKALDIDLTLDDLEQGGITDLDIAASMEDLEAQIAKAADELVKEGRAAAPAPKAAAPAQPKAPAPKPAAAARPAEQLRPAEPEAAGARPAPFTPANDDRQKDYRSLLQAMNRRVPTTVYWAVALLSVLWTGSGLLLANMLYGPQIWQIRSAAALAASPQAIALAVGVIVPVILFWGFAVMVRRAQEMRLTARSMAEVAMRLAEPESLAQDRVMTVGQAVRREVQAMGEGIERTLARAVELETLVHAEVSELERAYSDNEIRIRTLVDGLGSERDAVVGHAERVRASISGAHETLKEELAGASDALSERIRGAASQLSSTVARSEEHTSELQSPDTISYAVFCLG